MNSDTPSKSDSDRIAALEAQVAELRDICANLHNSIRYLFDLQNAAQLAAWSQFLRRDDAQRFMDEVDAKALGLDGSMAKAHTLIWGGERWGKMI